MHSIYDKMKDIVGEKNVSDNYFELINNTLDPFPNELDLKAHEKLPYLVVKPKDEKEVSEIFKLANKENIPVYPRGSGTSFIPECNLFITSIPNLCGGLKLGAGWCNALRPVLRGSGSNGWMVEIVWHRRETRRQQRKQTTTCTTRKTRSTHQKLVDSNAPACRLPAGRQGRQGLRIADWGRQALHLTCAVGIGDFL